MRSKFLSIGLVSTAFLSTLVPVTRAFPKFLQPAQNKDVPFAPSEYSVYEYPPPVTYGGYTWPGCGPAPTLSSSSVSTLLVATSEDSGAETSISGSSISAISGTSLATFPGAPHSTETYHTSYAETPTYSSTVRTSPRSSVVSTIMYISSSRALSTSLSTSSESISSTRGGNATSLQSGTTSNRYSTISAASTSTIHPLKCNHDNCLRQIIRASTVAAEFCVTYITAVNIISTDLPTFVSNCQNSPSRISSACSCVIIGPTTTPLTSLVSTSLNESSTSEGSQTVSPQPSQTSGGLAVSSSRSESSSKTLHPSSSISGGLTSITESTSATSSVTLPRNISSSNSKSRHRTSHRPSFSTIYSSGLSASGSPTKSSPSAPYPTSNLTSSGTRSWNSIASGGLNSSSKTKTHHRSHHTPSSATPSSSRSQPSRSALPSPSRPFQTSNSSLIVSTATGVSSSIFSNFSTSLYPQNVSSTASGVAGSTFVNLVLSSSTTLSYPSGNSSTIITSNGALPTSSFPMISVGSLTSWKSNVAGGISSFLQSSSVSYPVNSTLLVSSSTGTGNMQPTSSVSVVTGLSYAGGATSSIPQFPTTNSTIIFPTSTGFLHASTSHSPYTSGTRNVTLASHPLSHRSKGNHNMTMRKASSSYTVGNSGISRSKAHTLTKTGASGGIVSSTYEPSVRFPTINQTHSPSPAGNPAFSSTLNSGAGTSLSLHPYSAPYNSTYNSGPTGSLLASSTPILSHSPTSYRTSTSSPFGTTCTLNHSLLPTGLSSASAVTSLSTSSNQIFSTLPSNSFTAAGDFSSFSSSLELTTTIKLTSTVVSTLVISVRTSSNLGNLSTSSYIPPISNTQTSEVVSSFFASSSKTLGYSGTNAASTFPSTTTSENSGPTTSLSRYTPEGSSALPTTPSYHGTTAFSMHQFQPPPHKIEDEHHRHTGQEAYIDHGHGHGHGHEGHRVNDF